MAASSLILPSSSSSSSSSNRNQNMSVLILPTPPDLVIKVNQSLGFSGSRVWEREEDRHLERLDLIIVSDYWIQSWRLVGIQKKGDSDVDEFEGKFFKIDEFKGILHLLAGCRNWRLQTN